MWAVIISYSGQQEYLVLDKFNTKTNAQLFAEQYALQYVVNHDGLKSTNESVSRNTIDEMIKNTNIVKEDRHFIIRNQFPWGLTVNRVHIQQLPHIVTEEVDCIETRMVDEVVKTSKDVVTSGWFGRKTHKIQEETTITVPKPVSVKQSLTKTAYCRSANANDVFTVSLLHDNTTIAPIVAACDQERQEQLQSTNSIRAKCKSFSDRLRTTKVFAELRNGSKSIQTLVDKYQHEFDNFRSFQAMQDMAKALLDMRPSTAIKLFKSDTTSTVPTISACDNVMVTNIWQNDSSSDWDDRIRNRKSVLNQVTVIDNPKPPTTPPPPLPVKPNPVAGLACLNEDILARHRQMFGPKVHRRNTLDDATITNLCQEIERAIQEAEASAESDDESDDDESESSDSDDELDDEESNDDESDDDFNGAFDSNGFIFEPREISP